MVVVSTKWLGVYKKVYDYKNGYRFILTLLQIAIQFQAMSIIAARGCEKRFSSRNR